MTDATRIAPERLQQIRNVLGSMSLEADSKPTMFDELDSHIRYLEAQLAAVEARIDAAYKQGVEDAHRCEQRHAEIDKLQDRLTRLDAAVREGIPRYIEMFEQCGLGDGNQSVWVQQAKHALGGERGGMK